MWTDATSVFEEPSTVQWRDLQYGRCCDRYGFRLAGEPIFPDLQGDKLCDSFQSEWG